MEKQAVKETRILGICNVSEAELRKICALQVVKSNRLSHKTGPTRRPITIENHANFIDQKLESMVYQAF